MQLVGKRIVIRDFTLADVDEYWQYATDPQVAGPAGMRVPQTRRQAAVVVHRFITTHSDFAITLDDTVIGNIGAYPRTGDPDSPDVWTREIGYALARPLWGQGYMTEALELLSDFLFRSGMTALWAGVFPENQRSIVLLERAGFEYQFTVPLPLGLTQGQPRAEAYYRRLAGA